MVKANIFKKKQKQIYSSCWCSRTQQLKTHFGRFLAHVWQSHPQDEVRLYVWRSVAITSLANLHRRSTKTTSLVQFGAVYSLSVKFAGKTPLAPFDPFIPISQPSSCQNYIKITELNNWQSHFVVPTSLLLIAARFLDTSYLPLSPPYVGGGNVLIQSLSVC